MKGWSRITFILVAAAAIAGLFAVMPFGKGEMAVRSDERSRPIPQIDVGHLVSFETATFSLG